MSDKIYVTYTCKHCGNAFIDEDFENNINDIPLKTRYCPDCVKQGYKNFRNKLTKKEKQIVEINKFLKENNLDGQQARFCRKYINDQIKTCELYSKKIIMKNIFKYALEVLSYKGFDK